MEASLLALLLAAGAPALGAPAAAEPDCTAVAPSPMLKKSAYRGYRFERGPENTATEKAALGDAALTIETAGCYDGLEHSFTFAVRSPRESFDDLDHWLQFAARQLAALKLAGENGRGDVQELTAFLSGAAKKVAVGRSPSEVRLEACRDGSRPGDDGCAFATGGGDRFAVRKTATGVEVYVSAYSAL